MKYRTPSYGESTFDYYFFEKNLQGDIIAVYNESGAKIGTYTYDAWGNHTATAISTATALERLVVTKYNPFRYRGYYYDTETGFYYLQSRYYNPTWGRFINADGVAYLGAGSFASYNLFTYCGNNPVMGYDPMGTWDWNIFFGGIELLMIGVGAISIAITVGTCASTPAGMGIIAAATLLAGAATATNGVAEIIEAGTGENFVRNSFVFNGNDAAYSAYRDAMKTAAEVGTAICSAYYAYNGGNVCFIAGTLIATADGQKAIEDIEVGDLVWATDTETGETALKEVVRLFRNETKEWIHITVNGETITCTPEHPFYSPVKGWTNAIDLRAGDILVMLNGEYVVVEQVQHELLESPETTYNFEVKDFHTYYAGEWAILVHNRCSNELGKIGEQSSGITKNTTTININGRMRIPDGYNPQMWLQEVKNVKSLSYTSQLRDYFSYAAQNYLKMELYIRQTTQLSRPLQNAIKSMGVVIRYLP